MKYLAATEVLLRRFFKLRIRQTKIENHKVHQFYTKTQYRSLSVVIPQEEGIWSRNLDRSHSCNFVAEHELRDKVARQSCATCVTSVLHITNRSRVRGSAQLLYSCTKNAYEKACNKRMALKGTQCHPKLCYSMGRISLPINVHRAAKFTRLSSKF